MSNIQVILLGNMPKLGSFGEVVSVKRGYARNHLLPTGKARTYTPETMEVFEREKKKILKEREQVRENLVNLHGQLDGYLLQSVYKAQENGAMYGSVTQSSIVDLLKEQNIMIKRNQVIFPNNEAIKTIGEHEIIIKLDTDLEARLKFSALSDKD